jgi:protein arginine N-methyltransferase 7
MFVQRLNELTGEAEWVVTREGEGEEAVADALAGSDYLDMLQDGPRNAAFHAALCATAAGRLVLDVGTGSGLLALLAARSGASKVVACDVYPVMAALARQSVVENNQSERVEVFQCRSDELVVGTHLPRRADVLVFEVLDSELLGEGVLPTLRDARDRLLTPDAVVIPARARVHAALVQCEQLRQSCTHPLAEQQACVETLTTMAPVDALQLGSFEELRVLSQPVELLAFDFQAMPPPPCRGDGSSVRVCSATGGVAHAVAFWWHLDVSSDGGASYSTAPPWARDQPAPWTHHWRQCVAFLPNGGLRIPPGAAVTLRGSHDDHRIWFTLRLGSDAPTPAPAPSPDAAHEAGLGSRTRIWQQNNHDHQAALRRLVADAMDSAAAASLRVATLGDGPMLARFAAQHCACASVTALVSSPEQLAPVAEATQGLRACAALCRRFTAPEAPLEGTPFDVLLAEPHYSQLSAHLPWATAARLRHDLRRLRQAGALAAGAHVAPRRASLHAMVVSAPALWRTRAPLPHSIHGVRLRCADALLRPRERCQLPAALWQCGVGEECARALSCDTEVMSIDLLAAGESQEECCAALRVTRAGEAHAVALWISYDHAVEGGAPRVRPDGTFAAHWGRQGVQLLQKPLLLQEGHSLRLRACLRGAVLDVHVNPTTECV